MALELKNDPGLGTSDGLRFASPRAAASVANRYLLTINVDPTALRALLDSKRQYASSFERFPKLPVEMQLQIWEHAARKGPTMMVIPFDDDRKVRKNYFLDDEPKWSGAALLGVCRLSRDVATRVWGSNVRHISTPGSYGTSPVGRGLAVDLAMDAFYLRDRWEGLGRAMDVEVRPATIAIRYAPMKNPHCGDAFCPDIPEDVECGPCIRDVANNISRLRGYPREPGGIRRFAMVVEDFGDILTGKGKPTGPVYSTPPDSELTGLPEGTEFYDVTDGLTDATGGELFKTEEGKLQQLEDAQRVLAKIEKRWQKEVSEYSWRATMDGGVDIAFRIFIGVKN